MFYQKLLFLGKYLMQSLQSMKTYRKLNFPVVKPKLKHIFADISRD